MEQVEKKLAALEGGEKAKLFSSGVAAIAASVMSRVKTGDHIVIGGDSYGWTRYLCSTYLERFGVEAETVDASDTDQIAVAVRPWTRIVYVESPGSLVMRLVDIPAVADIARRAGAFTIVDNTWATPLYQNPLDLGAGIVVHSASKYLGGHSDIIGGAAVGSAEIIDEIFNREFLPIVHVPDPIQAWLIHRGMRTLEVRLERHYTGAMAVADFLHGHPAVEALHYPTASVSSPA